MWTGSFQKIQFNLQVKDDLTKIHLESLTAGIRLVAVLEDRNHRDRNWEDQDMDKEYDPTRIHLESLESLTAGIHLVAALEDKNHRDHNMVMDMDKEGDPTRIHLEYLESLTAGIHLVAALEDRNHRDHNMVMDMDNHNQVEAVADLLLAEDHNSLLPTPIRRNPGLNQNQFSQNRTPFLA